PGIERLVGLCINAVPVRVRIGRETPVQTYLRALQMEQADAREHEFLPPVRWRRFVKGASGTAPFDVLFVYENYPHRAGAATPSSLQITPILTIERPSFPLTAVVIPGETF